MKLVEFAKAQGAKSVKKANRGNGMFILLVDGDSKAIMTLPVGKKSQDATIAEMHILETKDDAGQPVYIATANPIVVEEVEL